MFLISAATALAAIVATVLACAVVVDAEFRVREERIQDSKPRLRAVRARFSGALLGGVKKLQAPWRTNRSEPVLG
jgi:sensor domain CHASE-containing protein